MKVGFFHDVKIIDGKDKKMYSIDFGYEVWKRYLDVFDQVVVCTRSEEQKNIDVSKYKISSGIRVEFKLNRLYKNPIQFFIQQSKIIKPIKDVVNEVDACIIRLPSVIGVLAAKECIRQNKPWAIEVVGCCWDSLWNYGNIQGKLFAPIMYLLNRYYINKATHAIYVSKEFLQKRYPCKGITASASDVNIDHVESKVLTQRRERINSNNNNDTIILGMIGSLNVEYKGHRTAIMSIKELKDRGYNVILKCLGSGDSYRWRCMCKDLDIEDRVEFCGTLPSGKPVLEWIDNIDIFVMPSLQEGLPRSMVEAMSRGCNIIGARTGGIPELIDKEFIFKPKDYKQMTNLIIKLITEKDFAINQSSRNFRESKQYIKYKVDNDKYLFLEDFNKYIEKQLNTINRIV